jgi:hypothetical protein
LKIKKPLIFLLTLFTLILIPLTGQDQSNPDEFVLSYHSKGDQTFSIEAGLFLPLFVSDLSGSAGIQNFSGKLNPGGSGFLSYCGYLDGNFRIGGEFGGMFASNINDNMFYMVPFMVKTVYDININTYFTVPLYLSAGITMNTYLELFSVDPIIVPAVGFNWNYDSEWSFTMKYSFWIVPEFAPDTSQSSLGVNSDLRFGVEYHF